MKYRVAIVEDHGVVREGIRALLTQHPDLEVICVEADGEGAIRCAREDEPDLILMDLSLPQMNGIDATRTIKTNHPEIRVLILTVHRTDHHIRAALKAGADGYILKDAVSEELIGAALKVLSGQSYLGPVVSQHVIRGYLNTEESRANASGVLRDLTERELEILKHIGEGLRSKQVAERLHISDKTVDKHRANIMKKLDIHSTAALTALAIRQGLTED